MATIMYYINKIVYFFANPLMIGLVFLLAGTILTAINRRKLGLTLLISSFLWFWWFNTRSLTYILGIPLEKQYYSIESVTNTPSASAIVILGGGMRYEEGMAYPDMSYGADRVWHGARLWKAGKAPVIIVSGNADLKSTVPLLKAFGIPDSAIRVDDQSRNTRENAQFTAKLLEKEFPGKKDVLLVTSAWHMPRALGNFSKTSLVVKPAPADFHVTADILGADWWDFFLPSPGGMDVNSFLFKEWLGRLAKK